METIKVYVNKQWDGYHFCTLPSGRQLIKSLAPNSRPANGIHVAYDIKSNYEVNYDIYPALLGIDNLSDLIDKVEIQFVDTSTDELLHSHKITA